MGQCGRFIRYLCSAVKTINIEQREEQGTSGETQLKCIQISIRLLDSVLVNSDQ